METFPSVAVVILNWNGKNFLDRFLPPLISSSYQNFRVFVADNGSTDGSGDFIRTRFPEVELLVLKENFGFAQGYNLALAQVRADYYVLLNSDVLVKEDWMERVIEFMERNKHVAACQPKILSFANKKLFEYAGAAGGWIDRYGYPFCRGRLFDHCEEDVGQYDAAAPIFWASGAALFVRAELFHRVGGFDPYFFAHQEEIDFCWRLQRAGYGVYAQPASVVYHVGGGTLEMGSQRKLYLNFRNNLVLLSKNLRLTQAIPKVFSRMTLDLIASIRAAVTGDWKTFRAIHSAHLDFCKWLFRHRKPIVLPKKKLSSYAGSYGGSVVWQYFVRKKKTFSEIVAGKKEL